MSQNTSHTLQFGTLAVSYYPDAAGLCFGFQNAGPKATYPVFQLQAGNNPGDCNVVAVAPHTLPDQFNIVACTRKAGAVAYNYILVEDVLKLNSQLKGVGVPADYIERWNKAYPHAALPVGDMGPQADAVMTKIMKRDGAAPE